jgi:phage shock protein PspC (stress-responsive transcriptional regulator)
MNDRLYRSRDDRMLAGVAGGLAEYWDADPSLIRLVWALLVIFTGGIALLVYIVMAIVVDEDPGVPVATAASEGPTWQPAPDWRSQRAASKAAAREARRASRAARGDAPRTGTLIVGGALVLFGAWFLLDEFVPWFRADLFWPLALVGLGVLILALAIRPRPQHLPTPSAGIGVPPAETPPTGTPPVAAPPAATPAGPTPPSPAPGHQP